MSMNPKSKGVGDRAITNNNIAEAYGWTIYDIEDAPAKELSEMLVARKAISDYRKANRHKPKPKGGKRPVKRRR